MGVHVLPIKLCFSWEFSCLVLTSAWSGTYIQFMSLLSDIHLGTNHSKFYAMLLMNWSQIYFGGIVCLKFITFNSLEENFLQNFQFHPCAACRKPELSVSFIQNCVTQWANEFSTNFLIIYGIQSVVMVKCECQPWFLNCDWKVFSVLLSCHCQYLMLWFIFTDFMMPDVYAILGHLNSGVTFIPVRSTRYYIAVFVDPWMTLKLVLYV